MIKHKNLKWLIIWVCWGLAFLGLEIYALVDVAEGDTLSEQIWWVTQWWPTWFTLLGFFIWLGLHFFTRKV